MRTVAIVGGGFSGSLVAIHLLMQESGANLRLLLVDSHPRIGRGLAYSTRRPEHLLNVPAGSMSAFERDPDHFLRWLHQRYPGASRASFQPRSLYGEYISELLEDTSRGPHHAAIECVTSRVLDLEVVEDRRAVLWLQNGRALTADDVILALGNFPPADPLRECSVLDRRSGYVADPWAPDALGGITPDEPVLLIGTGLTMADVAFSLDASGHRGTIHALSRHDLVPQAHDGDMGVGPGRDMDIVPLLTARTSTDLLAGFRAIVRDVSLAGGDWRDAVAAVRTSTPRIWRTLPPRERRRFIERIRPYWDTHRHRLPPEAAHKLKRLIASGRLRTYAGSLEKIQGDDCGLRVTARERGTDNRLQFRVSDIVNCTGPDTNVQRIDDPLIRNLVRRGLAAPDPLGLGFVTTPAGSLVDAAGAVSPVVRVVGALRKGALWESVAVPELRIQAEDAAQHIAALRGADVTAEAPWLRGVDETPHFAL